VVYEMKDGIPGMKFTADGRNGWTPVRKRHCPKCHDNGVFLLTQKAVVVTLTFHVVGGLSTVSVMSESLSQECNMVSYCAQSCGLKTEN